MTCTSPPLSTTKTSVELFCNFTILPGDVLLINNASLRPPLLIVTLSVTVNVLFNVVTLLTVNVSSISISSKVTRLGHCSVLVWRFKVFANLNPVTDPSNIFAVSIQSSGTLKLGFDILK